MHAQCVGYYLDITSINIHATPRTARHIYMRRAHRDIKKGKLSVRYAAAAAEEEEEEEEERPFPPCGARFFPSFSS